MRAHKVKAAPHFPVMAGSGPAPREKQIAGIVQMVWADSTLYHQDVEKLLREWLTAEHCVVTEGEFNALLKKAHGEFDRLSVGDGTGTKACPAHDIVECLYRDVEQFERPATH